MLCNTDMLREKYADYVNPLAKIKRKVDQGHLICIVRGVYESDPHTDPFCLAAVILSPSYISFDSALSYYGLIPERVYTITSASFEVRKKKTYTNNFDTYTFEDVPKNVFPQETTLIQNGDYWIKIARKEKAICDSLYHWRVVHSVKALKELLFEDKRIDPNGFFSCDKKKLTELASLYHKTNLNLLMKYLEKEDFHE